MEKKVSHGVCPCNPSARPWPQKDQEFKASGSGLHETLPQQNVEKIGYLVKRGRANLSILSLLCLTFDSPSFRDAPG